MKKIKAQNRLILIVIVIGILLMGIGYASISKTSLTLTGEVTAVATTDEEFKVYYTGNVIDSVASQAYITVDATPRALTTNATVNILGLSQKDDYGYAILEIENGSSNVNSTSIKVDINTSQFDGDAELFDIEVIMCDSDGNAISNYQVAAGEKTYAKVFAKLLKTPIVDSEARITAKIIASPEEGQTEPEPPQPITVEYEEITYYAQNVPIKGVNSMSANEGGYTHYPVIVHNKGNSTSNKTIQQMASTGFPYWYAYFVEKHDGKYIITSKVANDDISKSSMMIPANGFVLMVYNNVPFNMAGVEVGNEIVLRLNAGNLSDLGTQSKNGNTYGYFDIISGRETVTTILPPTDIFYAYYNQAQQVLNDMTLDEKVAQMIVMGAAKSYFSGLAQYKFGGYLFFADFLQGRSRNQIKSEINTLQRDILNAEGLPLITSIDEEGYTVSRLRTSGYLSESQAFRDPSELYQNGGFNLIRQDTITKANLLKDLGFNVNFAPDVDIAVEGNYIYNRTLKQGAAETSEYARTVISASKDTDVSFALKHFPGYGNAGDTHQGFKVDNRTREEFDNCDLLPFRAGIEAGAEMVMVTHNLVTCMDSNYPASISKNVHDVLRDELGFSGIIITDAINMGAIASTYSVREALIRAVNSGNDMICCSIDGTMYDSVGRVTVGYQTVIDYLKNAVENGEISIQTVDNAVRRIIAWKYYKKLLQ